MALALVRKIVRRVVVLGLGRFARLGWMLRELVFRTGILNWVLNWVLNWDGVLRVRKLVVEVEENGSGHRIE